MDQITGFHDLIGYDQHEILWWQMSIRGVLIFLFGLVLIRLLGRRAFGKQTPLDIVIAILVGSNLSRALTGNAAFFPTLIATAVVVVVFYAVEHLAARSHRFGWLVKGQPVVLASDGKLDETAMKRSAVSQGDVEEAARSSGIAELDGLQRAVLERSGKISAVARSR